MIKSAEIVLKISENQNIWMVLNSKVLLCLKLLIITIIALISHWSYLLLAFYLDASLASVTIYHSVFIKTKFESLEHKCYFKYYDFKLPSLLSLNWSLRLSWMADFFHILLHFKNLRCVNWDLRGKFSKTTHLPKVLPPYIVFISL